MKDQNVNEFQEWGATCIPGLFDDEWLSLLRAGIERNLREPSQYGARKLAENTGFFDDYQNWQRIPEFKEFIHHSPAAEVVAKLMQSETSVFYHEHVLIKGIGCQQKTPWHHDLPYYPVTGQQTCSLWIPLDPVAQDSAVRFVKGSHLWDQLFIPRKFIDAGDYAFEGQTEAVTICDETMDKAEQCVWAVAPGDCIAFNMKTVHGANGNLSSQHQRSAIALRWFGDDARFVTRPWEISPEETGNLKVGEAMACSQFPQVWPKRDGA